MSLIKRMINAIKCTCVLERNVPLSLRPPDLKRRDNLMIIFPLLLSPLIVAIPAMAAVFSANSYGLNIARNGTKMEKCDVKIRPNHAILIANAAHCMRRAI